MYYNFEGVNVCRIATMDRVFYSGYHHLGGGGWGL
jgi:hypothetical protein